MFANSPYPMPGASDLLCAPPALPPAPKTVIDPGDPVALAPALLGYLQQRFGNPALDYASSPRPIPDGWETYIYTFRLAGPGLPAGWDRPLVLRVHVHCQARGRARHEFAVPRYLAGRSFPVPEPVLCEEDCGLFGAPFLIMEQVAGTPLMDLLLHQPWNLLQYSGQLARTHARLHAVPLDGFPAPPTPFLARRFRAMRGTMTQLGLDGLLPGLDWLEAHQPLARPSPSILHLDYHPLNVIRRPDGELVVLDWTYADWGDPHLDVGMTLMILEAVPLQGRSWWDRLVTHVGRDVAAQWYLRCYRRERPLEPERLDYFRAWAALHQLERYGRWLRAPDASDCKAESTAHVGPAELAALADYFRRWTGLAVRL